MSGPDYSHRTFDGTTSDFKNFDDVDLIDSICTSVSHIESIIFQMQTQFMEGTGKVNDASNFNTLEVIRKEVLDVKAITEWFANNKVNKQSGEKS